MAQKSNFLRLKCPILVNWDNSLGIANRDTFYKWNLKHESNNLIVYLKSARGHRPFYWFLTRDALFYEILETGVSRNWAQPIHFFIRLVRIHAKILPGKKITKSEIVNLLKPLKPDNPDFNNRRDFERIIARKASDDYITESDMIEFFCIPEKAPAEYWPF